MDLYINLQLTVVSWLQAFLMTYLSDHIGQLNIHLTEFNSVETRETLYTE